MRRPRAAGAKGAAVSLLFFNLGEETGQLAFVTAILVTSELVRRVMALRFERAPIDALAAYWPIEGIAAFFVRNR